MTLTTIFADRLWHARHPIRVDPMAVDTRMTVARLGDGSLWVHSPIDPTPDLVAEIGMLGPVSHVVAPNRSHHRFFAPFLKAFPKAQGHIAPGLADKRPDLAAYPPVTAGNALWSDTLDGFFIEGIPALNETVWYHRDARTLILTDLLFCIGRHPASLAGTLAWLLGVRERLAMSRTMRLLIRDGAALARSVRPLLALDVERVVVAHDQIIDTDAARRLRDALTPVASHDRNLWTRTGR